MTDHIPVPKGLRGILDGKDIRLLFFCNPWEGLDHLRRHVLVPMSGEEPALPTSADQQSILKAARQRVNDLSSFVSAPHDGCLNNSAQTRLCPDCPMRERCFDAVQDIYALYCDALREAFAANGSEGYWHVHQPLKGYREQELSAGTCGMLAVTEQIRKSHSFNIKSAYKPACDYAAGLLGDQLARFYPGRLEGLMEENRLLALKDYIRRTTRRTGRECEKGFAIV